MINLIKIHCPTLLNYGVTYQIDGYLYKFNHTDGSIAFPQYVFKPLAGQRRTANLKLNRQKLLAKCYEVQGISRLVDVKSSEVVQLKLF